MEIIQNDEASEEVPIAHAPEAVDFSQRNSMIQEPQL
jgi:hypothetical protein